MYNFYTKRLIQLLCCISKIQLMTYRTLGRISETGKREWIMRVNLTTLLLITVILQVSAGSYAQKITLSEKNAPIKYVLDKIRTQSGYDFLFTTTNLKNAKPVTIQVKNADLKVVLEQVFEGQPFDYSVAKNSVVVSKKEASFLDKLKNVFSAIDVRGRVVDENGKPMAGVSIKLKDNSGRPIVTNEQGFFITTVPDNSVLVFSYVGYTTRELPVRPSMLIVMQLSQNKLEETVVVGYGSTKRKDLTGSVSSVNINEIRDVPYATIDQALSGKASGVQVVQSDGSPGGVAKIRIRGGTSLLGGNDPLYIIDGVQVQVQNRYQQAAADIVSPTERSGNDSPNGTIAGSFARGLNSLGGLNINDIESIDILKDASATAIYGSRAANGVVIITTKKGKTNQKPTMEANYYLGMTKAKAEEVLNREQYITIMKEAAKNLNDARAAKAQASDPVANQILNNPDFLGPASTNWMDLVLRNGITQNADLAVRGGGTGSRYYTSLTYNKNEGTVKGTDYRRIAGKISLDNEINSKLRFSTNLDYGFTTNNVTNGLYTQALFAPPTFEAYNADGSVKILDPASIGAYAYQGYQNPLALLKGINRSNGILLLGSLAAEYDILKELKFRSSVAVNYNNYRQNNYVPSTTSIATPSGSGSSNNGIATQSQAEDVNMFYENTLTWSREFNADNRLTVLVGTSWQKTKSNSFSASGQGFPDDIYLNNLSSAAVTLPSTGLSGRSSLLSFYMRANYALFDKYLFTFTGRSDASSKFPENNRVGYFPSGGVAWRISQENFLKRVKWIDDIKLRASMGYTGTQNIADNLFYTLYSPVSYAGMNGLSPSQLGNNKLKWESTLQKDAGINIQLFGSRLRAEVGYYSKVTTGILFPATVAGSSGFSGVTANIAKIRNNGLEFELGGDFIRNKNFQWSGNFNISGNRSKVLALSNDFADPSNPKTYTYGNTVLKVGEPLGLLYGKIFDGIMQNQAEVDEYKQRSYYANYILSYVGVGDDRFKLGTPIVGNFALYKDDIIGHAEPNFYGGYTNTLSYKGFMLSALATFSSGGDIYYLADIQNQDVSSRANKGVRILDRWTPENTNTTVPKLVLGQSNYAYASSNNVHDASFIRLKSVTFSYQLPKNLISKINMTNASVYVSGTNLITITSYPGADPEVSNDPYSLIGGYSDSGGYPSVRQFSFGVRFGF